MKYICYLLSFFIVFSGYLLPTVFYKPGAIAIHETVGNNVKAVGAVSSDWNFFALTSFLSPIRAIRDFSQGITVLPDLDAVKLAELHQAWLIGHGRSALNSKSVVLALKNKKILASNNGTCTCCFGCSFDQYDEAFEARINQNIRCIQGGGAQEQEPASGRYFAIIATIGDIGLLDAIILFKNCLKVWQENECNIATLSQEHQDLMSNYVKDNLSDCWSLLSRFPLDIQRALFPCGYISVMFILIDNNKL